MPAIRCLLMCTLLSLSMPSFAQRVALVIGNSDYQHTAALSNPAADAKLIGASLTKAGFQVTRLLDLGDAAFERALVEFGRSSQGAEVALIYYAGHGIEFGGQNWLLPIDAKLEDDLALEVEAISLDRMLGVLAGAHNRIVILDACRDNPFRNMRVTGDKTRSVSPGGLAEVSLDRGMQPIVGDKPIGTLIAFAAATGAKAKDGPGGGNSPFAAALAQHLVSPGVALSVVFNRVRDTVLAKTDNQQIPWINYSMGELVLVADLTSGKGGTSPIVKYLDPSAKQSFARLPPIGLRQIARFSFPATSRKTEDETKPSLLGVSKDGKQVAVLGHDGATYLLSAADGSQSTLKIQTEAARALLFGPVTADIFDSKVYLRQAMEGMGAVFSSTTGAMIEDWKGSIALEFSGDFYFRTLPGSGSCALLSGKIESFPRINFNKDALSSGCWIENTYFIKDGVFVVGKSYEEKRFARIFSFPSLLLDQELPNGTIAVSNYRDLRFEWDEIRNIGKLIRNGTSYIDKSTPFKPASVKFSGDQRFVAILSDEVVGIKMIQEKLIVDAAQIKWPGFDICGIDFTTGSRGIFIKCRDNAALIDLGTGIVVHQVISIASASRNFATGPSNRIVAFLSTDDSDLGVDVFEIIE